MSRKKAVLSAFVSAVIFIMVFFPWYHLYTRVNWHAFVREFISGLKYFTNISNLMMGISALIHLIFSAIVLSGRKKTVPGWVELIFYISTTALSLTFGTVMVYLGPRSGYGNMLEQTGLYYHLIIPLLSILSMCLLHRGCRISLKDSFLTLIPLILYGIYYADRIFRYGVRHPRADWYRFGAALGKKGIPFIFLVIGAGTWGSAMLIRLAVNSRSGAAVSDPGKNFS